MVKAKLNGQFEMILPDHRAAREEWYTPYGWEKKRLASMHKNLDATDTIYYIGAEEGEMCALCQIWGARVVMFEPNPKVWSSIKSIWEANSLEKPAGVFPGFASNVTKKATNPQADMTLGEDGYPRCAHEEIIAAHGFKEIDKESESYDQIKIDDYVQQTRVVPTAITLDVEGAEGIVLDGARETLKNFHPKIWLSGHHEFLCNTFSGAGGFDSLRAICHWLKEDLGYEMEMLDFDHELHLYFHI